MATRPNKKRKGRNNAPPRERTVTTLTDGPEGSFLPSQLADDPATAAALISPHLSYPVSPPIGSYIGVGLMDPLSAVQDTYGPHSSFSAVNNYTMSSIAGSAFNAQHSPPHFYPQSHLPQSQPQTMPVNPVPPQQVLPPGQNDLEILEKLKETIKKNQHELFRPIPQPAALASVYLGPKPALASVVPPHPEQIPTDVSPPGLTLFSDDHAKAQNGAPAAANALSQPTSRVAPPTPSQTRDSAKKLPHRSSVSESPRINTSPGKRSSHRYSTSASPTKLDNSAATDIGAKRYADADEPSRVDPPGLQRLEHVPVSLRSPEKPGRNDSRVATMSSSQLVSAEVPSLSSKGDMRVSGSSWNSRSSVEGQQQRHETNSSSTRYIAESPPTSHTVTPSLATGDTTRPLPTREQRTYERERDRERDSQRGVDRERSRACEEPNRARDDRRTDERPRTADSRRLSPDTRRHEPRHPSRRYDSKASETSFTSPRLSDKSPPGPRPYRNLGEERAIVRPPPDPSVPRPALPEERHKVAPLPVSADNSSARLLPATVDDRHASSLPDPDRQVRPREDRQAPSLPTFNDRPERVEERRLPHLDRSGTTVDDRHHPASPPLTDRKARSVDDRRDPGLSAPATLVEKPIRATDDNRALLPVTAERPAPLPVEARRTQVLPGDVTAEERRPHLLETRISRAPATAGQHDPVPSRPLLEERATRPMHVEERNTRPVPLEERISRAPPSLQERLSAPPVRSDDRPAPRLEDRLSRPANMPPSLEERLSNPTGPDDRSLRSSSDDRTSRPLPLPVERPVPRPAESRSILPEVVHPQHTAERPVTRAEERVFTPANRTIRPTTPVGSDRGHPPLPPSRSYRAPSVAPAGTRDETQRSYRPPSPGRSPVRPDIRETRPAGEPRERERLAYRSGPDDRYVPERRPAPAPTPALAAGQDLMEVDSVHSRAVESRLSYRRPSPPPAEIYPSRDRDRDRAWVPAGEAYREPEAGRRMAAEPPHSYTRDWREEQRVYGDDWHERSWDRPHEYDRDARYVERDAAPPGWETREDRERRGAYPPDMPPPSTSRAYERPLSSRLTDPYPEDRAYLDRGRYPPVEPPPPPASYSRVRPRSPSPLGRRGAGDDMRPPPMKRAREDPYYYPDDPPRGAPVDYPPPRLRSPPPPPSGAYYDDPRYPPSPPGARERDYPDRDVLGYAPYDRRADSVARMPPPPRSPPPYARAPYGRDDRRYSMPPRA
ncbi:hypothetical protein C8Q73DRAFT_648877 [Cubamyces lactineus]|nr:hypothetical protein C8Q73DRAFT_648877 [Cubamyces lactineus]